MWLPGGLHGRLCLWHAGTPRWTCSHGTGIKRYMKLQNLLTVDALSDARYAALNVRGISADSRSVKPGDLFVAIAGSKDDGLKFVAPAVAKGAVAVMAERVLRVLDDPCNFLHGRLVGGAPQTDRAQTKGTFVKFPRLSSCEFHRIRPWK